MGPGPATLGAAPIAGHAPGTGGPEEAGRLAALQRIELLDTEPERAFDDIVNVLAQVCEAPMAAVSLVDESRQWFKARRGLAAEQTPRSQAFCAFTILQTGIFEVPDALSDERFASNPLVAGPPFVRFYAAAPLRSPDGYAVGTLCVLDRKPKKLTKSQREVLRALADQVNDQVELRLAGRELRRSTVFYRRLLERASGVALVITAEGRILFASPGVWDIVGHTEAELLGKDAFPFTHPDDVEKGRMLLSSALADPGVPKTGQIRVRHRDGTHHYLRIVNTSFVDDAAVGGVVVNLQDVTQEVLMVRAAQASERTFASLVQHSSDIIVVVESGRVRFVSPAVTPLLGYEIGQVLGRKALDFVDPRHHSLVGAMLAREVASSGGEAVELQLRRADGRYVWFEARSAESSGDPATGAVVNLRDIDDRKRYEDQLRRRALYDELTGLPNRALLEDRVDQRLNSVTEHERTCALLFVDMDRFKLINETSGHDAGDEVLREVGRRLVDAVGPGDTVARFGSDEFAVFCEDVRGIEDAVARSVRLHDRLRRPVLVRSMELSVTACVGIAVAGPGARTNALVQAADTAVHVAKERGRGRTEVFEERLRTQLVNQLELLVSLQRALDSHDLSVAYQPVVRLADRSMVGVEALVRWRRPGHGEMLPGAFVPLAEEAGLIGELGIQVLRQAAVHASQWSRTSRGFFVAVNVSARQLAGKELSLAVLGELRSAGAPSQAVVLEVTESSLLGSDEVTMANLAALKEGGVRIAIDDFGTGYSSLASLRDLGAKMLKIDGSFVKEVVTSKAGRAIVAGTIELGHALGLAVVGEHVEQEAQASVLAELGCDLGQGYLFGRPGPPDAIVPPRWP